MNKSNAKTLTVAAVQLCSQTDIDANLAIIRDAVHDAAAQGARLVVLPENACVMGRQSALAARFDEMVAFFKKLACECGVYLLAGTLPCPVRPDGTAVHEKVRQSSLLFDDAGRQIARYDKIHLFRAQVNDGVGAYDEGKTFEAGDEPIVAACVIDGVAVNIGLMICFDVRFAAMAARLRQMGADIITMPAAFTYQTGKAHWQLLLQARSLDSQCMIIGAAQGGSHHIGSSVRETWGHALISDAHGQVLATTDSTEVGKLGYRLAVAHFDGEYQAKVRRDMPIFECQRLG